MSGTENRSNRNTGVLLALCLLCALILAGVLFFSHRLGGTLTDSYPVRISELCARNKSFPNAEGELCDWIELQNVSGRDFDLGGYCLTDVPGEAKYVFPAGTILRSGGYLVVWCRSEGGEGYAPFGIARAGGETITLENRTHAALDRVVTIENPADASQVRSGAVLICSDMPSPGFENSEAGHEKALAACTKGGLCPVVLSEILSSNALFPASDGICRDIIELRNPSAEPFNLSGFALSDREDAMKYVFPAEAVIPGGGVLVVWCGGEKLPGTLWAPFAMSKDGGETVCLLSDTGAVIDSVTLPALGDNQSYSRGEAGWSVKLTPDPGA